MKRSRDGDEAQPHKDNAYITTNPLSCQVYWVAIDDSSKEDGCLVAVPGSHKEAPNSFFKLRENPITKVKEMYYEPEDVQPYDTRDSVALEVEAGSLVLFDGNLTHWGHPGAKNDRTTYIMHIVEGEKNVKWADSWLQRPPP